MHPATWYKVEFDDQIVTFRPSALHPVDANDQPLAAYAVKPSVSKYTTVRERALESSMVTKLAGM